MKYFLTIILTIILIQITHGQPYKSLFYSDTTRWSVETCIIDGNDIFNFYTNSDTIINSLYYKKIYGSYWCFPENTRFMAFIREDKLTGQVWYRVQIDEEWKEFLIMDLSLIENDKFLYYPNLYVNVADTLTVDSIYYNEDRKIIHFTNNSYFNYHTNELLFIEEIGPSNGICYPDGHAGIYSLLCKFQNNQHTFTSPLNTHNVSVCYNPCYDIIKKETQSFFFKIEKNINSINVSVSKNRKELSLEVYSLQGRKIKLQPLFLGDNRVFLSKSGLYIFRIFDDQNSSSSKVLYLN